MARSKFRFNAIVIGLLFVSRMTFAEEPGYKVGKALETAMSARVTWSSKVPLGDQLRDLQNQTEVAVLRDRRVDPSPLISIETDSVPRIQVLQEISATIPEGAFCVTEHLAFVGSADVVHRLPILIERNNNQINELRKKLSANAFRKIRSNIDASWDELAEPRQILLDQAAAVGATIRNPDAVPHDVWAGRRLPKMPFAEAATVILNQFELTLNVATDDAELTIVPIDTQETLEHRYTVGSRLKASVSAEWQSRAPAVEVKWAGSNAIVTATLEQHALLNSIRSELSVPAASNSAAGSPRLSIRTTSFQLKAERATVGQLIAYFRDNKVPIEVVDAESEKAKALLDDIVHLNEITKKNRGTDFFPLIFGKHFRTVEVKDDRVILTP